MKKGGGKKPPKVVQLSVHQGGKGAAWNTSPEGVLRKALEEHEKHGYTDIVIVALRSEGPDTFTFCSDRLRALGLLQWSSSLMTGRFKS